MSKQIMDDTAFDLIHLFIKPTKAYAIHLTWFHINHCDCRTFPCVRCRTLGIAFQDETYAECKPQFKARAEQWLLKNGYIERILP